MDKINFVDGEIKENAHIVINGQKYYLVEETYENESQIKFLSAQNLNKLQDNIEKAINGATLVGQVIAYAGKTVPDGYLLCNGDSVSRTTYANLFKAIGTTYGSGNGSTTFNLPELTGRVLVGAGFMEATGTINVGQKGGEAEHKLTIDELPELESKLNIFADTSQSNKWGVSIEQTTSYAGEAKSLNDILQENGGGQSHNNMQPYIGINYIIKY